MGHQKFSLIEVSARTHPPAYAIHKYWARKPHNVLRTVFEACGIEPGDLVLDPFCGSGVPLSEAADLGARCVGFDVNPMAVELTRLTLSPPRADSFRKTFDSLLRESERDLAHLYELDGRVLRYAVHATVVRCANCLGMVSADMAIKSGRTNRCPECQERLYFNLENMVATRVLRVLFDDGTELTMNPAPLEERQRTVESSFDQQFEHNPRILAFNGMRTQDLFTRRNFAVLALIAKRICALPAEAQPAARVTLTSALAQCSRLIAYRNNLSTGGPAWTVPGFWVPPLHLETNPLVHLRARLDRTYRGLQHLQQLSGRGANHLVREGDAAELLASHSFGRPVALAFIDPPYGDSVPYLEFSSLWNSFLGKLPDPGLDIAVSNRSRGDGTWEAYSARLSIIIRAIRDILQTDGKVVVTFNNKDPRAWKAILGALQRAKLCCQGAFYQHPAVVSAKAQLARRGSYVGDVYCVFVPSDEAPSLVTTPISAALSRTIASGSDDAPSDEDLRRVAILEMLRHNLDANCLDELGNLIEEAKRSS